MFSGNHVLLQSGCIVFWLALVSACRMSEIQCKQGSVCAGSVGESVQATPVHCIKAEAVMCMPTSRQSTRAGRTRSAETSSSAPFIRLKSNEEKRQLPVSDQPACTVLFLLIEFLCVRVSAVSPPILAVLAGCSGWLAFQPGCEFNQACISTWL